jgi:hypothetical protein
MDPTFTPVCDAKSYLTDKDCFCNECKDLPPNYKCETKCTDPKEACCPDPKFTWNDPTTGVAKCLD